MEDVVFDLLELKVKRGRLARKKGVLLGVINAVRVLST